MHPFSLAQSIGYLAFLFGAAAFLQKNDRRLKFLNGTQCIFYALHFTLLGNLPAAGSLGISAARSFVSLKSQSRWLAAFFLTLNIVVGSMLVHNRLGWLPVAGGCLATTALFLMRGVPMRVVLLMSTLCWLVNNILSGSIGGMMLETTIACANISTMVRLFRAPAVLPQNPTEQAMAAAAGDD
jgi:hypothetical protein